MIMKTMAAALIASAATAAAAQPAPPRPNPPAPPILIVPTAPPAPTADPASLAAARLVDSLWPQSEVDRFVGTFVTQAAGQAVRLDSGAARRDPHHAERLRITQEVIGVEAGRLVRDLAPEVRRLMARHYVSRFSADELVAAAGFYMTPTGTRFGRESLALFSSPEYLAAMETLQPRAIAAMEGVQQRVAAAMAQIPPPPSARGARRAPARPPAVPPAPPMPEEPPLDLAALSPAERAAALVWPPALFRHVGDYVPVVDAVLGMRVGEFGLPVPAGATVRSDSTIAEVAGARDPHLQERARLAARLFGQEMARFGAAMAPDFRRVMAQQYARRFSPAELEEIAGFYASPAGRKLAAESYRWLEDPQFVRSFVLLMPRAAMQIPAVVQRVNAATAHLPPVPPAPPPAPRGPGRDRDDGDED